LDYDLPASRPLAALARTISGCRACPRLARYLDDMRAKFPDHRCLPVPGWGDPDPALVIVGLAPGLHGAGKTGRMFTFDSSGQWLYGMMHEVGLASRPVSTAPSDGLELRRVWITAAARCAPPRNKPTPAELDACRPFLKSELDGFPRVRVLLALGRIAHDTTLRVLGLRATSFPFSHGAEHALPDGRTLLDSYHPSRQNTNTGRLTRPMWRGIFRRVRALMS
jgi:uracil-DNA glycosylase family 4